uniref:Peptidase M24 domain-containing protein n=1 Tax=Ananas comosus var. bracteatus TaxID=296719 RepID=A0A6V7NKM0_ANACO|nr:unnamed protein product [Ananas comosus var. bracteatus]
MIGLSSLSPRSPSSFLEPLMRSISSLEYEGFDAILCRMVLIMFFGDFNGGKAIVQKRCVISSSKLSALEEAMRVRRLRELQSSVKIRKRPPLRRGKVSGPLVVPEHIPRPSYVGSNEMPELFGEHQIHDAEGIAGMRAACELAGRVLDFAGTLVRPSITTNEIDKAVHNMITEAGAYPSPLGYGGFPKSVCTSVNECVCHGVPDSRQLQNGDIVNIDVTVFLNGYHGDTSKTFLCGDVNEPVKRLVKVTEECLERAISVCKDGATLKRLGRELGNLIPAIITKKSWKFYKIHLFPNLFLKNYPSEHAEKFGYGVVERLLGMVLGLFFTLSLLYYITVSNDKSGRMVEGQTFTIEPILTMGSIECVTWDDGWTTVTADGGRAAQFEHTILITRTGAEVLTKF